MAIMLLTLSGIGFFIIKGKNKFYLVFQMVKAPIRLNFMHVNSPIEVNWATHVHKVMRKSLQNGAHSRPS